MNIENLDYVGCDEFGVDGDVNASGAPLLSLWVVLVALHTQVVGGVIIISIEAEVKHSEDLKCGSISKSRVTKCLKAICQYCKGVWWRDKPI